jgi:hypothetical protein
MSEEIRVEFQYQKKMYKGLLGRPNGGGGGWYLSVYDVRNGKSGWYYRGVLIQYTNDDWQMTGHHGELVELSDYFRDVVLAWYQ